MSFSWNFDDTSCQLVLRAVYGLAKGRADNSVSVASVANQTGLDDADIDRAINLMVREGLAVIGAESTRLSLTTAGASSAKAEAEEQTDLVFADAR